MFRITEDPSSGSLVHCLAKNYKNDSIVPVDMDKFGVMTAYSDPLCVCCALYMKAVNSKLTSLIYCSQPSTRSCTWYVVVY